MRIAMLSADYPPNIGGVSGHVFNLSKTLLNRGHEVTVFIPTTDSQDPAGESVQCVALRYAGRGGRLGRMRTRHRVITAELGLRLDSYDVLHQHDHAYSSLAARAMSSRIPWIWTNHASTFAAHAQQRLRRRYLGWLYRPTRGLIAVTEERLQVSQRLWPAKMMVQIPNGVDTSTFHPAVDADRSNLGLDAADLVVLCPGRLVPVKGGLVLAYAAQRLVRQRTEIPWRFVFAGGGNGEDEVYRRALNGALAPLGDRAVVLPALNASRMAALYAAADVVAFPSLREGSSLAALEAMAMRRPVVASELGSFIELLGYGARGVVAKPGSAADLAHAISTAVDDGEAGLSRVEAAYDHVITNHTWDHIAAETERFYERVIA